MKIRALLKRLTEKLENITVVDRRRLHSLWEVDHLRRLLKLYEVDCVFDVGANNGQYARMLRDQANFRGLIISFEPNSEGAAETRRRGSGDARWLVQESALSFSDGIKSFNIMHDSQFSSFSSPRQTEELQQFKLRNSVSRTVNVKTETLTTAYNRLQIEHTFSRPFLKMDTQGFDVQIINHAGPALQRFVGLQSELAVERLYNDSVDFREAITLYESLGFSLSAFVPNNAGHFPHLMEFDCIMIRRFLPSERELDGSRG